MKISLQPGLLVWARQRAGFSQEALAKRMGLPRPTVVDAWERTGTLTLLQAEKLASVTLTPFGDLFLPAPPAKSLPITDFRTVETQPVGQPSPELLAVIAEAQRRQDWYREYLVARDEAPLPFVGSLHVGEDPVAAAARIRDTLQWLPAGAMSAGTWEDVLNHRIEAAEGAGVLVMRNGVVENNTSRPLNVHEFRGFTLSDSLEPLLFLNGRDSKAAQGFTLAHELVHIWLGLSGVSLLTDSYAPNAGCDSRL